MSEQETRILVGRRVREERQAAGYARLEDFAAELGIDPTNLSRIERGERGLDSLLLARIATLLNVPMDAFFDAERGEVLSMARGGVESATTWSTGAWSCWPTSTSRRA